MVARIEELFSDLDAGEAALKRAKENANRAHDEANGTTATSKWTRAKI